MPCRSTLSASSSRPHLAFLVQQSDSAIGSSLGGSCSFLPPPPPYRPPHCSSGSEGAISAIANQMAKQREISKTGGRTSQDFTALLGFDCIVPKAKMANEAEEGEGNREEDGRKRREAKERNQQRRRKKINRDGSDERRAEGRRTAHQSNEQTTSLVRKGRDGLGRKAFILGGKWQKGYWPKFMAIGPERAPFLSNILV